MIGEKSTIVIEWADRFEKEIKRLSKKEIKLVWVKIEYGEKKNERRISYEDIGY